MYLPQGQFHNIIPLYSGGTINNSIINIMIKISYENRYSVRNKGLYSCETLNGKLMEN